MCEMKKLYIAHIESSLNWGGQELRVLEQIEWLIKNDYKSVIIARPQSKILEEAKKRNLPHFELQIKGSANPFQIKKLINFLQNEKVNILDAHSSRDASYALFVKLLTNIKVIRSRHITNAIHNDFIHSLIWKYGSHSIITTANKIKLDIVNLKLFNKNKIYVATAGVDEKKFHPNININKLKETLQIPEKNIVISNVGMIRPDKGQKYFVEMCKILAKEYDNITFLQIGEATQETQKYKNEILKDLENSVYSDRIKFIGYKDDIENYLALTDIIVISSIKTEAQTRLVSQNFLMKNNVVATNVGGLPEMIEDHKTGLLCEAKDPNDLAHKVNLLLKDLKLKNLLADNAYNYAIQYSTFNYMMKGMLRTYNNTIYGSNSNENS